MTEEKLKLAVFVDFDNIQIGVKDTLGKEFDVSVVLEALKERGEVVTKVAYGDWHRAGDQSRQMTQHAVHMVQRNVTPRGDKNGADINLALDALEMAFTRHHINAFAIVGGDSDFIALVEKLKQYDKWVFVVGGRAFTSLILQRNCHEFIAYENLLRSPAASDGSRPARSSRVPGRPSAESRPITAALPNIQRALKILAEREVAPQLGLLKSTLLQLDSTFTERDFGAGSFLEFVQKMERAGLVRLRRTDRSYLVESANGEGRSKSEPPTAEAAGGFEAGGAEASESLAAGESGQEGPPSGELETIRASAEAVVLLKQAVAAATEKFPNRPLYMRHIRQALRSVDKTFDERRYGFRGILDLLHQGQREGWLSLTRDRKGVWRVFPVSSAQPAAEPVVAAADLTAVAPTDDAAPEVEASGQPTLDLEEDVTAEEVPPESLAATVPEDGPPEAPIERKVRKPRSAGTSGKTARRKPAARRKTKEPTED